MGIFGRKKSLPQPLPPPEIDDGVWRRTLKQADMRASVKRDKLLESIAVTEHEAASLIASARPSVAAQRVATILPANTESAALEALSRAASSLHAVLPSLTNSPASFGDLNRTAQAHLSTILLAGDAPPLIPEAAHLAGQINAYFSSPSVAAFRAAVEPDPAIITFRTSKHPPTPQEVSEAMQAIARDYDVRLPAEAESVPPAIAKAVHSTNPPRGQATSDYPVEVQPSLRPRIVRVDGRPSVDGRHSDDFREGYESHKFAASDGNIMSGPTLSGMHELEPPVTPPHLRNYEPTTPILTSVGIDGARSHPSEKIESRSTITQWGEPKEAAGSRAVDLQGPTRSSHDVPLRRDVSARNTMYPEEHFPLGGAGSERKRTPTAVQFPSTRERQVPQVSSASDRNTVPSPAYQQPRGYQVPHAFVDNDEMLLLRYRELMTI